MSDGPDDRAAFAIERHRDAIYDLIEVMEPDEVIRHLEHVVEQMRDELAELAETEERLP